MRWGFINWKYISGISLIPNPHGTAATNNEPQTATTTTTSGPLYSRIVISCIRRTRICHCRLCFSLFCALSGLFSRHFAHYAWVVLGRVCLCACVHVRAVTNHWRSAMPENGGDKKRDLSHGKRALWLAELSGPMTWPRFVIRFDVQWAILKSSRSYVWFLIIFFLLLYPGIRGWFDNCSEVLSKNWRNCKRSEFLLLQLARKLCHKSVTS